MMPLDPAEKKEYQNQRSILKELLPLSVEDPDLKEQLESLGVVPSYANAICLAALRKAAGGDMTAYRAIRDAMDDVQEEEKRPVRSMELSKLTDEELERLADMEEE